MEKYHCYITVKGTISIWVSICPIPGVPQKKVDFYQRV